MTEFVLKMLATVLAVHLFWIVPMCNAIRERPKLVMNVMNDENERSDDIDGNSDKEADC